jgi:hypothetical protein
MYLGLAWFGMDGDEMQKVEVALGWPSIKAGPGPGPGQNNGDPLNTRLADATHASGCQKR